MNRAVAPETGRETHATRKGTTVELSARNQIAATVTDIKLGGVMAEITVQIAGGQELVSVITRSSAERLGLQAGDQVTVIIKSTEVMLGK